MHPSKNSSHSLSDRSKILSRLNQTAAKRTSTNSTSGLNFPQPVLSAEPDFTATTSTTSNNSNNNSAITSTTNSSLTLKKSDVILVRESLEFLQENIDTNQVGSSEDTRSHLSSSVNKNKNSVRVSTIDLVTNQVHTENLYDYDSSSSIADSARLHHTTNTNNTSTTVNRPTTPTDSDPSLLRSSLALSQSFDKDIVESLLHRFQTLSKNKRNYLLKVLKDLEGGNVNEVDQSARDSLEYVAKNSTSTSRSNSANSTVSVSKVLSSSILSSNILRRSQAETPFTSTDAPLPSLKKPPPIHPPTNNSDDQYVTATFSPSSSTSAPRKPNLSIHILSTYNPNSTHLGLTSLQFFDHNHSKILINPTTLNLSYYNNNDNCSTGASSGPLSISGTQVRSLLAYNKNINTTNSNEMISIPIQPTTFNSSQPTESGVLFNFFINETILKSIHFVDIFNYNASENMDHAVQRIRIMRAGMMVFDGELKRRSGVSGEMNPVNRIVIDQSKPPHVDSSGNKAQGSINPIQLDPSITKTTHSNINNINTNAMDENSLQKSFESLQHFKQNHAGRVLVQRAEDETETSPTPTTIKPTHTNTVDFIDQSFQVPVLPRGARLVFNLLTTHGDTHYIGLNGIELFDLTGSLVHFPNIHTAIQAFPSSVRVLEGYENDPRVVSNLLNGSNETTSDFSIWLTPYSAGKKHLIIIDLPSQVSGLSMIRIWNFNKSRIHTSRGVENMQIWLDNLEIFRGKIQKASGEVQGSEQFTENILFTQDYEIIRNILKQSTNKSSNTSVDSDVDVHSLGEKFSRQSLVDPELTVGSSVDFSVLRPKTAHEPFTSTTLDQHQSASRTTTNITTNTNTHSTQKLSTNNTTCSHPVVTSLLPQLHCVSGIEIIIFIGATWGDLHFVGLTGIELLDHNAHNIPIFPHQITAFPQDINSIPGHSGDNRTLDKLCNGLNLTQHDSNMWLCPFLHPQLNVHATLTLPNTTTNQPATQWLKIQLDSVQKLSGIVLYNYNKSVEDSYRGVKWCKIFIDSTEVSPDGGFLVRRAPGNIEFDYGQKIFWRKNRNDWSKNCNSINNNTSSIVPSSAIPVVLPTGYLLKFVLLSNYGDEHFIGLNGIEVFDHTGRIVGISKEQVIAKPDEALLVGDSRTVDKLFNHCNQTYNDDQMYLAYYQNTPALNSRIKYEHSNYILVNFPYPVRVSALKVWNYSKTVSRGVQELAVYMDDNLIYTGKLQAAVDRKENVSMQNDWSQWILFQNNLQIVGLNSITGSINTGGVHSLEQEVGFINENKLVGGSLFAPARLNNEQNKNTFRPTTAAQ